LDELRFELGRVVAPLPYHNQYLVRFVGSKGTDLASTLDDGGDVRGGVAGGPAYLPGTTVLAAVLDESSPLFKQHGVQNLIVAAFAPFPVHRQNTNIVPRDIVLDSPSGYNQNESYRLIIENETVQTINQDRSYNRATDAVPGEWYRSTVMGGVLLLSDFLTRVGASERCFLEWNSLCDEISGQIDGMDIDGEATRLRLKNYGDQVLRIASDAYNRCEGLGGAGQAPLQSPSEPVEGDLSTRVECVSETQRGFFRLEEMAGGAVEGYLRAFKTDAGSGVDGVFEDGDVVFPGVLREDARMDGKFRLQAIKEILLEKRPYISVPYEIAEEEGDNEEYTVPELQDDRIFLENLVGGADEYAKLQHLFPNQIAELEALYHQRVLREKNSLWKIPSQDELEEALGESSEDLDPLSDDSSAYTLEDIANIIMEVYPGRPIRVFKNSSMFLMADDGGVRIGDGFGAEIRMERGNMTIACAGDLKIQPGRDMIEWVPRNKITKVRKRAETTSSNGSVVLKAEENLQLLSGNGGSGATVIENRSINTNLSTIDVDQIKEGRAIGSGVHIRSKSSGVSILGSYIYGAGYPRAFDSQQGLNPTQCNILFDAGSGIGTIRGSAVSLLGVNSASVAMESSSTGAYASSTGLALVGANDVAIITQQAYVQGGGGTVVSKPFVNSNGVQDRSVRIGAGAGNLSVSGFAVIGEGVGIRGSLNVTGTGVANGGFGRPQTEVNVSVLSSGGAGNYAAAAGQFTENLYSFMTGVGVQTEYGQAILEPAFPDSDSQAYKAKNFSIPETSWQQRLNTSAKWVESEVPHSILEETTLPYPGRQVYENAVGVMQSVNVEDGLPEPVKKPLSDYKVNTST
jgi:hypothetical protein